MTDPIAELATLRGELREEKKYAEALRESKVDAERLLSKKIEELLTLRKPLEQLADPDSWEGNPRDQRSLLLGHFTPFEMAKEALGELGKSRDAR